MNYGTYPHSQQYPQQYPQTPYPQLPAGYPGYGSTYAPVPQPYTLPPRGHSPVGVVSFVLAILSGLGIFALVISATVMAARRSAGQGPAFDDQSPQSMAIGLVFLLSVFGAFVGVALGIGALFQVDRKRVFALLGLCLNLLVLVSVIGLVLLGMAAGQG